MQATSKEIYNRVQKVSDIDLSKIKFVGDTVFGEWNKSLKEPETIIIKIKNLGRQYLRRNKLIAATSKLRSSLNKEIEYKSEDHFLTKEEQKYRLDLYEDRLIDYEKFVTKKKEIQKIRYKTQPVIEPQEKEEWD